MDGSVSPLAASAAWIGRSVRRVEDDRLLRGAGRFVNDLRSAGCLHLEFCRSPYQAGRIVRLDVAAARAAPGVVAVFTAEDCAGHGAAAVNALLPGIAAPPFALLAEGRVAAAGQAVAAVVADTPAAARDAAALVELEMEEQAPEARLAFAHRWQSGAAAEAFSAAAHVVRVDIAHATLAPMAMEPRATLAEWSEGLTVWLSTQTPHRARADLANILHLPAESLRVIAPDVGGAFGGKASIAPEDAMVAWACRALRRPVRWCATRGEDFLAATRGRGARIAAELALDAQGRALALRAKLDFPLGHWLPYSAAAPARNAARILPGPYAIPEVDIVVEGRTRATAAMNIYRGAGRPEACMVMERLMDRAAVVTGIDGVTLRRRNLIGPAALPGPTPTGEVLDATDLPALLDAACRRAGHDALLRVRDARRVAGEVVGVGLALYVEPCGQGWESARVGLASDGTILAATGSSAQGQGRETAYAQIVCQVLNTDFARVRIEHGDTGAAPPGIGALASRSTAIGGSALHRATTAFLTRARAAAGRRLNRAPAELEPGPDGLHAPDGAALRWAALAGEDGLTAEEVYHAPEEAWASGCCIALLSIAADTGIPTVEKLVWVDDAGVVVNPMLVQGQLLGGLAQGFGEAMMERLVHDAHGQLLTGSLMDYAVPRAADVPQVTLDKLATPSAANTLGAKGVGEAGCIGVPAAIVNAAVDALSPFGVTHLDMPLTSEKLWRAMNGATA